jgi:hypothetical protein
MVEVIWGILNIGILIYFVIICLKSTKIIREKLGVFAVLIFVFGLLSFVGKPNDENPKIKIFDLQDQIKEAKLNRFVGNTYSIEKKLEDNLMSQIELSIKFGENGNEKKLLTAYTNRSGFVSGTNWKTEMVNIQKSKTENKCYYNISGTLEWRLLGLKVYSEPKDFEGEMELKK